ncbi:MAG: hypothetical protein HXS52_07570 [Theionarchaea archaeon]|nr:hypothetical protein [Theionarchaea archaeon]
MNYLVTGTYVVAIAAGLVLSLYFFRDYFAKRLRASLAWAVGLFLYSLTQIQPILVEVSGPTQVGVLAMTLGFMVLALAMVLLYYGASQLFFSSGSFFREKFSVILLVIFFSIIALFSIFADEQDFIAGATVLSGIIVMGPIKFSIAFLFYRVYRRLEAGDPRRRTVSLLAYGWALDALTAVIFGLALSVAVEAATHLLHAVAWIVIFYGMAIGKVTRR